MSYRLGLRSGLTVPAPAAPPGGFDPATLFGVGDVGMFVDFSDLSTLFQNSDGTGAVAVGDPIGRATAIAGDRNLTQATTAKRPILRETGGKYYAEFDGIDDVFNLDVPESDLTVAYSYTPTASNFIMLFHQGGWGNWLGIGQSGSASTLADGTTQDALYFDGGATGGTTRGSQYTAAQGATSMIWVGSTSSTLLSKIGFYTATFPKLGDVHAFLFIDRKLTAGEIADLDTWLKGKA